VEKLDKTTQQNIVTLCKLLMENGKDMPDDIRNTVIRQIEMMMMSSRPVYVNEKELLSDPIKKWNY